MLLNCADVVYDSTRLFNPTSENVVLCCFRRQLALRTVKYLATVDQNFFEKIVFVPTLTYFSFLCQDNPTTN